MEKQAQLHPEKQPMKLQKLIDTHWVCHFAAVNAICCMYDSVLLSLEEIAESHDAAKAIEARGLYHQAGVDLELNTWGGGHLVGVVSLNECGPMILRAKII